MFLQAANAKTMQIAYFDLAPHTSDQDNKGPIIDYFKSVLKKANLHNYEIKKYPLSRLLKELKNNELDMAIFLGKNPEREKYLEFSEIPIFKTQAGILVPKKFSQDKIFLNKELKNKKICFWKDGYIPSYLKEKNEKDTCKLSGNNIVPRAIQMLIHQRANVFYSPDISTLHYSIKQDKIAQQKLKVLALEDEFIMLYPAFSKNASVKWKAKIEAALLELSNKAPYTVAN